MKRSANRAAQIASAGSKNKRLVFTSTIRPEEEFRAASG